jgi:hypothetical protein
LPARDHPARRGHCSVVRQNPSSGITLGWNAFITVMLADEVRDLHDLSGTRAQL